MRSYFIFKNTDSRALNVLLDGPARLMRGEERVTRVTVPGRPGELILPQGEDIYESYVQTLHIRFRSEFYGEIARWLRGEGDVTFSSQSDRVQTARVLGPLDFEKLSFNLDWYEGDVPFLCQPYKRLLSELTQSVTASCRLTNRGDVIERPVFAVTGTGDFTLTVNSSAFTLEGLTGTAIIDCENRLVTDGGGSLLTSSSSGSFPALERGGNDITWTGSGITAVTVARKERFL